MMPLLVRRLERLGDLLRDWQGLVERNRSARDALRQILAFDELHDEGRHAVRLFEPEDLRNVRMIERGEDFGLALEARQPLAIAGDISG